MAEPCQKTEGEEKRECLSVQRGGLPCEGARRHAFHGARTLLRTTGSRRKRSENAIAGAQLSGRWRPRRRKEGRPEKASRSGVIAAREMERIASGSRFI
jgi:hypothetical protein